jgi:hypothetical protein
LGRGALLARNGAGWQRAAAAARARACALGAALRRGVAAAACRGAGAALCRRRLRARAELHRRHAAGWARQLPRR